MSQVLAFFAIYVLGLSVVLAFGPRRDPLVCCAVAFLCGLTILVLGVLPIIVFPLPYGGGSVIVVGGLIFAAAAVGLARSWRPERREVLSIAVWSVGFLLALLVLCSFDGSRFSPDSRNILTSSRLIAREVTQGYYYFVRKSAFLPVVHGWAEFLPVGYLYSLSLVVGTSSLALFAVMCKRGLERLGVVSAYNGWVVAGAIVTVATTYMFTYHLFYIHNNMGSAAYLLGFVTLFWLADEANDSTYLAPAFLCLIAFALHRLEAPIFAAVFVVLTVFQSRLPRRHLSMGLLAYALVIVPWYLYITLALPALHLTPARGLLVEFSAVAMLVYGVLWTRYGFVDRLNRYIPVALLCLISLAIALGVVRHPDIAELSLKAMLENMFHPKWRMWGLAWPAVIALAIAACFAPRLRFGRVFSYGIVVAVGVVFFIGTQNPWRAARNDSANRIVLHFLPLLYFFFVLKFAPLFAREAHHDDGSRSIGASSSASAPATSAST